MNYIQKETTKPFKKNIWGSVGDFFLTDSDWKLSNNATYPGRYLNGMIEGEFEE